MKMADKIFKIKTDKLPPSVDFIENEIKQRGIDPVRWAIIDVKENMLTLSVAGIEI